MNCDLAGICRGQAIFRAYRHNGLTMARGIVHLPAGGSSPLVVPNYRHRTVTLPKGTILRIAELYEGDVRAPNGDGPVKPFGVIAATAHPEQGDSNVEDPFDDQDSSDVRTED